MKKSFLMLGVAAMALASCTNEEVLNVAENRAIGFDAFVGKPTKAVMKNEDFREFSVFGGYGESLKNVFDNQKVSSTDGTNWTYTPTKYWTKEKTYTFQAYSPFIDPETASATATATAKGVNFSGFVADGATDLLVSDVVTMNGSTAGPISLTFRHILSLINFKFSTDINGATITISNLKVNALPNKGNYTNANTTGAWSVSESGNYDMTVANGVTISAPQTSTSVMVLPQTPADKAISVTFTVNATGSIEIKDAPHTVYLPTTALEEGKQYTYTAIITASNIDPGNPLEEIEFGDPTVSEWKTPITEHPVDTEK